MSRFAAGDDAAFARLVERETPRLIDRVERRLPAALRARIGASDIVQHTAVELISLRKKFENRGVDAFRGFMNTLADFNLARAIERERAQKRNVDREVRPSSSTDSQSESPWPEVPAESTSPSLLAHRREVGS
ncbi:MAG: hypothetical protein KDC38_02710, partial [Planctomycetes bacterium]|nr:hypothetical protein [Planctomycetota bacterium]